MDTPKLASAYTPAQLTKYLNYIALPDQYAQYTNQPKSFPKTEEALKDLFRCQITRFPYDNLTCHYSTTQLAEIQPEKIYTTVIGGSESNPRSCRGGYCLEMGIFFHHILRGLGFSVYMTGGRSWDRIDGIPQGEFRGCPLPLISGQVTKNLGSQELRLIYDNIPKQTRKEQKVWIYQYRNAADKPWNSYYSFAELEFFQDDFEVMNRFTSWEAVEKRSFAVVKFIRNGETAGLPLLEGEVLENTDDVFVAGKIMMVNNAVKLNMGGRTRVIDSFETEDGRFEARKKWFSIYL
ncbi:N-acetyltransferase [Penicillium camemberti]|uniref:N-acetyltransferase n=1 Tax=Penicillium camemberti (strain FM 013) TaxID=1429867 RepID=A0A0G4NTJ9_PENC3|nr:N-acetyltransferase [Penicillium camemberti]